MSVRDTQLIVKPAPKRADQKPSSASEFRFASLVALGSCPIVCYAAFSGTTWMMLLGMLFAPLAILARLPGRDELQFAFDLPRIRSPHCRRFLSLCTELCFCRTWRW